MSNLARTGCGSRQPGTPGRIVYALSPILLALIGASYAVVTPVAGSVACRLVAQTAGVPNLADCSVAAQSVPAVSQLCRSSHRVPRRAVGIISSSGDSRCLTTR